MVDDDIFYLKWSNFQPNINNQFERLRENEDLVDITFACEGKKIGAHKLILFACSPYFKELLMANGSHSVFFMYGVRYEILKAIIQYMYLGEVHISNENLKEFIQTAESLQIRGLTKDEAIKIPKPVMEVTPTDLICGGGDDHFDSSTKRIAKQRVGGKRMRMNEENVVDNHHQMYISHHDPIPVDITNDGVGVGQGNIGSVQKPDILMPKPIEKRNPYHEEGQVEPKLEMDETTDMPDYCNHPRQIEQQQQQHLHQHQQQPVQQQQQVQTQHVQQSQHHHHHAHQTKIPLQTQQQPPPPPPTQQHLVIGGSNQGPNMIPENYDRPGTSTHSTGGTQHAPLKPDYEQISENNQTVNNSEEDVKFKSKREATPKLTKFQESSRACPVCSRIYSSVSNLRQHMRLIHNPTYVCCPICQKYFNTDLYLRRHISGIHRGENIDWPPPYENNQPTPNSIC